MGKSKIIYGGKVLIDLTSDTITEDKLLSGYTAHGADGEPITGSCTYDADTQDATASESEILGSKTAYVRGVKRTGTMPNNGAVIIKIANKDDMIQIAQGYHDGSGYAVLDENELAKLIENNIREGITLADTPEDAQLIEMYAAYLYRSRRDTSLQMPRMLRWALNNRLFGAKARETVDG